MPQGPIFALRRPPQPAPNAPPLDQTPFRVTNPRLAAIEDFLLAAAGIRDGIGPESSKAATLGAGFGLMIPAGLAAMAAVGRRVVAAKQAIPARQAIKAYHGSPHDFDKFSLEKIGTGEGAQAYGHGLYFAENPKVAQDYKKNLANGTYVSTEGLKAYGPLHDEMQAAAKAAGASPPDHARAIANYVLDGIEVYGSPQKFRQQFEFPAGYEKAYEAALKVAESKAVRPNPGKMYEVNLNASPDDFLDWDKPLSQQSEKVKERLKAILPDAFAKMHGRPYQSSGAEMTGGQFYEYAMAGDKYGASRATDQALQAGIKGIRYADQGSRGGRPMYRGDTAHLSAAQSFKGANYSPESALAGMKQAYPKAKPNELQAAVDEAYDITRKTSNYVVFDDAIIDIMKKYGVTLPIAAGLYHKIQAAQANRKVEHR